MSSTTPDDDRREEVGNWIHDAILRKQGLLMIAAVEAALAGEDEHFHEILDPKTTTSGNRFDDRLMASPELRFQAALQLLVTLVGLSDDREELLDRVRQCLIDRPAPPSYVFDDDGQGASGF
jgi:hypothetical protein